MTDEITDEQGEATPSDETTEASASESSEQLQEEASEPETSEEDNDAGEGEEESEDKSESLLVTPEELKAIKADPTLSKLYRSLNKGFTENSQKRAAQVREAEQAMQLVQALRADPQGTIQLLAQQAQVQLGASKAPDADVHQQMTELFGEEVGAKVAQAVQKLIDERTSGLKQTVEGTVKDIKATAGVEATKAFRDAHPDLNEVIAHDASGAPITVEQKMLQLMSEFDVKGTVDSHTYLTRFYKMAKAEVDSKVQAARVAAKLGAKLEKSAGASKSPGSPAAAKVALEFPRGKGAFAKAAAMALRGERAG